MLRLLTTLDRGIQWVLRWLVVILMVAMTGTVFLQVVFRYLLGAPLGWSEEFARFVFVWVTFMGAACLVRLDQHIRVATFREMFGRPLQVTATILGHLAALGCVSIFLIGGVGITRKEWIQLAPAMQIEMGWVYLAIPIASALMVVWILASLVRSVVGAVRGDMP